jgi:hypothetical protein
MSQQSVKAKEVRMVALEEELEKVKATAKRCREDIAALRKEQRKEILNPNQGELKLMVKKGKERAEVGE